MRLRYSARTVDKKEALHAQYAALAFCANAAPPLKLQSAG
jgi:hypothetical protein